MVQSPAKGLFPIVYSLGFFLAAGLSILMLITDKNLQTDFGTVPAYYVHWYAILAMAVADLAGAVLLLLLRSRTAVKLGVVGSGLLIVALLGAILTWQQVGFGSASDFAQYLFGITYYGGDVRYLYDVLLATYIGTFLAGVVGLAVTRARKEPTSPAQGRNSVSAGP